MCYSQWTQKGDTEVFISLSYIISYTVKMLRLTVTSSLGTLGGGAGGIWRIGHFTVMDGSKAGVDLVLKQTFLPFYVNQVTLNLMLTSICQEQFP